MSQPVTGCQGVPQRARPARARHTAAAVFVVLLGAGPGTGLTADWPQWRGPTLTGFSPERNLPETWSRDENVAWALPLPGRSGSTPVIAGDRIFLHVADGEGGLFLYAVDRNDGKVLWTRLLDTGDARRHKHNLSSPSPVTDGDGVYVLTGTGVLKAFGVDGTERWTRDLAAEFGPPAQKWGYASSPLLHDDGLFIQMLHAPDSGAPSYVLRLHTSNGALLWRAERRTGARHESPDAYSTPGLYRQGRRAFLIISGGDVVTAHDPDTGREIWRAAVLNPGDHPSQRIVASPLAAGGLVIAFGKRGPVVGLRPGGEGDVTATHVAWTLDRGTDVPTPATDGKSIYMVTDKGIMWCLEARSGRVLWGPERLEVGTYSASPVLADGKVYLTSEDGTTTVLAAGRRFQVLAVNRLDAFTLSSPAISGGQIFLRTDGHLFAIGEAKARRPAWDLQPADPRDEAKERRASGPGPAHRPAGRAERRRL